jgi:hypothetical protein
MKQTAVEWLVEQLKEYDFSPIENTYLIEIPSWIFKEKFNHAKEMEKEKNHSEYMRGWKDGLTKQGPPPPPLDRKIYR